MLGKALFLLYHFHKSQTLDIPEILKIFLYGLRLDISFAAYIAVLPFLAFFISALFPRVISLKPIRIYSYILIVLVALLMVVDLELYKAWGFRLDATPLQYLDTPQEMAASAGGAPVFLLVFIFILFSAAGIYIYLNWSKKFKIEDKRNPLYIFFSFFCLVFLIVPIRGGFQHIPINQSDVYFSENVFANHAAINVPWNVMYSISKKNYANKNPYNYLPDSTAQKLVQDLYKTPESIISVPIVKTAKPNVLFIILESYTGKLVGCLNGEPGVTPNLDKLAKAGILFDSIYASGDRSEKGLVALLSAYPVQTTTSIIKTPRKTEKLPHLNKILEANGYHSSYYYGGELAFANIKSYLLNAGYDKLVSKFDFPATDYNSKWGVHDHLLFNRVLTDLKQETQPFFSTIFTLSSHEPYDIPIPAKFKGSDETTQFKNSMYYTDVALGNFIREAKKQAWWHNTIIVLAADHGHRLPGEETNDQPTKFRIPLILTGGALTKRDTIISTVGSQTDIVPTLLSAINLPPAKSDASIYTWGSNLLNKAKKPFAFYVFNDGFGLVTDKGVVTFDNISKKVLQKTPNLPDNQLNLGKAYMQYSFGNFLKK